MEQKDLLKRSNVLNEARLHATPSSHNSAIKSRDGIAPRPMPFRKRGSNFASPEASGWLALRWG